MSNEMKISEMLGIRPWEPPPAPMIEIKDEDTGIDATTDYNINRSALHGVIKVGTEALAALANVASSSEVARDYEVVGKLMDSIANATKTLKDIHKKEQETRTPNNINGDAPVINVDKAIFTGTTAELLHALKDMKKE